MNRIRVLIADDHSLVRSGLRALLEAQPDIEVVGEAENGAVALEYCRKLRPEVVVMDLAMPGRAGINATEDIRRECVETRVVVLTMHDDEAYVRMARLAGASAFVLKKALATELIRAIRTAHAGKTQFSATDLPPPKTTGAMPLDLITGREREVLSLIALGHTTVEIAGKLHISEKTVETHRAHIMDKLGLRSRADLVRFALDHDLLRP
jgi:two-component system, NarL family, response regulator NreC